MKVNKQTILLGTSIVGVLATTTVTAVMAPKAYEAIKAKKLEIRTKPGYSDIRCDRHGYPTKILPEDKLELVKTAAPYYIPTTLLLLLTIGSVVLSHKEYKKELAAVTAASAYLVANRDKLKKVLEKPEVKKIVDKVYPEKKEFKSQTIETTGNGDLLCIDGYSGRIFRSSQEACIDAQDKLIQQYIDDKYCCMNDYYRFLGIQETQFGYDHGWANNEDWYYKDEPIQFNNELISADAPGNEFGEPIFCMDIEQEWYPMECWMEI